MQTLTRRELNRALLARQLLLERAETTVPLALQRICGIQAQYAPSMYIGLWSRVAGLQRADVTAALEQRTAVQATLMRVTIHLVARKDYWPFALATRETRRSLWQRATPGAPSDPEMVAAARTLRSELHPAGVLRRKQIETLLQRPTSAGVGLWVDLVRATPSGTWERRRADLFALAEDWIGGPEVGEDDAADHLVRRYLGGFGPASRKDIASFTGIALTPLDEVLSRLTLRRFADEDGGELLDVPDGPLPPADTPAPVRFLPTWDAMLLVHARRTGVLPEEYRPRLFHTKAPQSYPSFLVDGAVAGTWRYDAGRITLAPFAPLSSSVARALDEESERLVAFHA